MHQLIQVFHRLLRHIQCDVPHRPFARFDRSPLTRIVFLLFFSLLVIATLMVSFHIALHRVRASEREMDMATTSLMTGQFESAVEHYDQALRGFHRKRQAWSGRALALMYLKRYDEALASYEQVIRLSPENASAWHGKGMSLEYLGRYNEALAAYNRAIELDPGFGLAERQRDRLINLQNQLHQQ